MAKGSKATTSTVKGVVIREKHPRDEIPVVSPSKKGKVVDDSKGKETMPSCEAKKKATKPNKTTSMTATPVFALGEETSANPDDVLGPTVSMLENPTWRRNF